MHADGEYTDKATVRVVLGDLEPSDGVWELTVQPQGLFDRRDFIESLTEIVEALDDAGADLEVENLEFRDSFSASILNVILEVGLEESIALAYASLVTIGVNIADKLKRQVPVVTLTEEVAIRRCRRELAYRYVVNFDDLELVSMELRTGNGAVGEFRSLDGTVYLVELALVAGAVALARTKRTRA